MDESVDVVSQLDRIAALDQIAVQGLRGRGLHGVYPRERAEGQTFIVDMVLFVDTRAAARDDDLTATADYSSISEKIVAVIEGEPVNLIETLAQRVADVCLAEARVRRVRVTVHKPDAPIAVPFEDVTVTIERGAADRS